LFVREFDLVEVKELAPLQDFITAINDRYPRLETPTKTKELSDDDEERDKGSYTSPHDSWNTVIIEKDANFYVQKLCLQENLESVEGLKKIIEFMKKG
jgi:hypothetical protein